VAAKIDKLGFSPTKFLPNLICKHENLYWVDFGFDLGDSHGEPFLRAKGLAIAELGLSDVEREIFVTCYETLASNRDILSPRKK
jgi:hypothetical protein